MNQNDPQHKMANHQRIEISFLPTTDRKSTVILIQSPEPIPAITLLDAVENFAQAMRNKIVEQQSKLVAPDKKLIVP